MLIGKTRMLQHILVVTKLRESQQKKNSIFFQIFNSFYIIFTGLMLIGKTRKLQKNLVVTKLQESLNKQKIFFFLILLTVFT